jgi:DNA-binding LacI/PurR family transcriptional regulator
MSRPTLRDVAELAGVSISVASNALNDKGRVSVETRRRVQIAAQELEYVANYSARRLRGGGDRTVGVLVGTGPETLVSSRYFRESLQALSHTVAGMALKLHFIYVSPQSLDETSLQQIPSDGALDGAMVIAPALSQIDLITETWAGFPHVLFSASPNLADVSFVDSDGRAGARMAIQHFLDLGHTRIACLMPPDKDNSNAVDRLGGYRSAMQEAGAPPFVYITREWNSRPPLDAMLADGITAVFAFDDLYAIRLIGDLERRGLRVPQDMAVIGFDDEEVGRWMHPSLTTVRQPLTDMGTQAATYLTSRLDGREVDPLQRILPVELIVRDSCGARVGPSN